MTIAMTILQLILGVISAVVVSIVALFVTKPAHDGIPTVRVTEPR